MASNSEPTQSASSKSSAVPSANGQAQQQVELREVHLLITKGNIFGMSAFDDGIPASVLQAFNLDGVIRHWALRIGDTVFDLRHTDGVNESYEEPWSKVQGSFQVKEYLGPTTSTYDEVRQIAAMLITRAPMYDLVEANCQAFVVELNKLLRRPGGDNRWSELAPGSLLEGFCILRDDVLRYVAEFEKYKVDTLSIKDLLDSIIETKEDTKQMACKCVAWLFDIVIKYGVDCSRLAPVVAAIAAALLVAWLCHEGYKKFRKWRESYSSDRGNGHDQSGAPTPNCEADGINVMRRRHKAREAPMA